MTAAYIPACDGRRPTCEICCDRGWIFDNGQASACGCAALPARENCPTCRGEGVKRTRCCGYRSQPNCCCAYSDGYDIEVCPDCEEAATADEAEAA